MPTARPLPPLLPVMLSRRLKRLLFSGAAFVAFAVSAIGLLHTPLGRPLLAKLGVGCPITKATAAQIDHARTIPAAAYLGKGPAPTRPALGFTFEKTTLAEVEAWAKGHGIACETINGNETLRSCKDVPATALGESADFVAAEAVDFEFRASRTLAVLTVLRRGLTVEKANTMAAGMSGRLHDALGAPQRVAGENTRAHFAKGPLQAFQEEYAFGDYGATLTETRLGSTGVLLREHYFSPVP